MIAGGAVQGGNADQRTKALQAEIDELRLRLGQMPRNSAGN